jgi:hypothetical protein
MISDYAVYQKQDSSSRDCAAQNDDLDQVAFIVAPPKSSSAMTEKCLSIRYLHHLPLVSTASSSSAASLLENLLVFVIKICYE